MKNVKKLFFLMALIMLILSVSTVVSATNDTTNVNTISESSTDTNTVEPQLASASSNKVIKNTTTKEINKKTTDENIKTTTKTVEVNNMNEFTTAINSAVQDADNDEYIINLNAGTYQITANTIFNAGTYRPNIIINANNQTLTANPISRYFKFNNGCKITIKNATINNPIDTLTDLSIYDSTISNGITPRSITLNIQNSALNSYINIMGNSTIIIGDGCTVSEQFKLNNAGEKVTILTNNTEVIEQLKTNGIYVGNNTIRNTIQTTGITNKGTLTFTNSTMDAAISNYGVLVISDDTILGSNLKISGNGEIIINDTGRIATYLPEIYGNNIIENRTVTDSKSNYGNLTVINSTISNINNHGNLTVINSTISNIGNHGNVTFKNSTLTGTLTIYEGTLIFADDVIFGSKFKIAMKNSTAEIIINDISRISPYFDVYYGEYIIENANINAVKTNNGNLTINNSNLTRQITNNGNLVINNSVFNQSAEIVNNGNLTIINSETINCKVTNNGNIIFDNSTLKRSYEMKNSGTITLNNSIVNASISNSGTLIIANNTIFTDSGFYLFGNGVVIADDINKYFKYIYQFTGETTIELGDYDRSINNLGNLTIENSTLTKPITNTQTLHLINTTVDTTIDNTGTLIISDDTVLGENFKITGTGNIITNDTQRVADYLTTYTGNIVLENKTINTNKINEGRLTLNNCTVNSTIKNNGRIIIDDDTVFGENAKITGTGEIVINDITKILPIIDTINGNYVINDTTLNKSYTFNGKVILNNCTTNQADNNNFGSLTLNNCSIDVGEDNVFLDNFGTVFVSKDTELVGKINDLGGETTYDGRAKTYVVNNRTLSIFFDGTGLTSIVNPGDILDFQGTITPNSGVGGLIINKPINIITTTNDGKIDGFGVINYTKGASGSNVTGLFTHNTQFYVWNADHITFDNISNVVEDKKIGWGVGQSSIRENSSYITVKNSYFYTKDNGGSSTLVFAWANYCNVINCTLEGDGMVGNLLYLTTYNVKIPENIIYNSHNILANNTIRGPETAAAICYGICLSGYDNLVDGNTINYSGSGIMFQWGSGVDGIETEESLFGSGENIVCNNILTGGCGIGAGNVIFNNTLVDGSLFISNAIAYNNTAKTLEIGTNTTVATNNTILENVKIRSTSRPYSLIANNTICGNIEIPHAETPTNVILTGNNITGSITLDGSNNTITNNNITTDEEYTISSKRNCLNNKITDNYLMAKTKGGDASVNLRDESNIIENNIPITTMITIIAQSEATVNTTIPVTIMLTDMKGNLIPQQEVTITTDSNETITLKNGVAIYNYTPTSIGLETITITYDGLGDLMAKTVNTTIKVTPDKDQIIEDLNNTAQEQTETINDLNNTVNSQDKTIQELEQNLTEANNKIDKLNNNITNLNNQVKDLTNENKELKDNLTTANTKIATQDKTIQDLNKSLIDANKALADANKQLKELNSTVAKLNEQIKNMTTPIDTKVTINTITAVKYSSDVKITGTLTDKTGNAIKNTAVTLNINGKANNVATDNKGTYTYTAKATKVGTNNVTVQYTANDKYNAAKATSTFKVNKQDLKITINNITSDAYKEDVTVTGVFTDATGKGLSNTNINLTINGKTVKVKTTAGGVFTYTTKANKVGTNNLTVTYAGNNNYNKATTKTTFKVVKQDLIVTIDNLDDVRFKENITISGKFVDGNAKPIGNTKLTINLNGKKYTVKTNAQGVYKRSIRVTQIDKNNVTVTYNGNANYNKATTKATFKAIKQNLGITLDSVKTANGKITVTGTFTDEESKPLMNSNVKVTINGKTYTAKTDNKGIYTLTKACTASNITLTLSYAGNKNYNSFTKTTKLTV